MPKKAKDIINETFSEDLIQAVADAGVTLTLLSVNEGNNTYSDKLFMGIRPEKEFMDSGSLTYKDTDESWYWTHSNAVSMPDAGENADEVLLNGLAEMSEKYDRETFKNEIKEHFDIKMFHGKDLDKCADKAEAIMSEAIEAAEKVVEKEKSDKEIE